MPGKFGYRAFHRKLERKRETGSDLMMELVCKWFVREIHHFSYISAKAAAQQQQQQWHPTQLQCSKKLINRLLDSIFAADKDFGTLDKDCPRKTKEKLRCTGSRISSAGKSLLTGSRIPNLLLIKS